MVIITWVGFPIDSLESIGSLPVEPRESTGSSTQWSLLSLLLVIIVIHIYMVVEQLCEFHLNMRYSYYCYYSYMFLPSGHYYLGGIPYRFPGIDREPPCRFQGIDREPYPVVIIIIIISYNCYTYLYGC